MSLFANIQGTGPETIVLLHGVGGSHAVWADIVPQLATEAGLIAYDLPGHGASLEAESARSPKRMAEAILADLVERGIGRAHLVGHSMGGAIATLIALADPDRFASLTLLAPGGYGEEIDADLLRRFAAAEDPDEIRACLAAMSGPGHIVSDRIVADAMAMRARPGQLKKLREIVATIAKGGRQGVIPADLLAKLTMPVAVAWGVLDSVLPVSQADTLPDRFDLHLVPVAGHMLPDEAPGLIVELLRGIIRNSV
ncbi:MULTISPECIES: alpha/beta fold hydrolase [Phyllobacteriaceae]|jgi:pimeloyl-ACP methyl ester carboxylesterase|uniref:Dihydrolipoamide acetyltransferase n=1 Tax=Mesorhizobium hungaricum TaxID=1566387 RepID=A0A1C2E8Z3_9HYPH|nr:MULTISPECIES: alpha/beta fold hydrolase [Mesorhizobium]MBN9236706.1 alpha/beta fold hydrolase [Mesorhizobium sp.]MDQ0329131.1 pyruvate dehydrogenase E2 component (dihydrolipoamide acetyltransferase) [Mesorhizobium sp. YL-MeA3-2017]OCX23439.1 dihydrolipoamide acetyltransferase [Mesorhizobium hungaricum]